MPIGLNPRSRGFSTSLDPNGTGQSLDLDRPVGTEDEPAAQPCGIVAFGQRRHRLPIVGAQACGERRIVAEGQEDAAVGLVFGAQTVVDQRVGIEREPTAGSSCASPTGIA